MGLQELANEQNKKVYVYCMTDGSIEHSFVRLPVGNSLNGKVIKDIMGAFIPQDKVTRSPQS